MLKTMSPSSVGAERPGQRPGASIASVRSAAPGSSPPAAHRRSDLQQPEAMAAWL